MNEKSSLKEQLRRLEEKLLQPEVRSSQLELQKLLAPNFFEIGSSGKVLYQNEPISKAGIPTVDMSLSEFTIHPMSEEIVLATYKVYNATKHQHTLRSSLWKKVQNQWKMVFHQGTIAQE
ncbi:nuclear transport factor 2 family protein [Bacillus sp. 2205SS5-2]|uniref:nuclear transport factor 2 family protein n=1 Tax=Bacillus sp. 2205SS5-2 TaxID=3109031 RepID=UPI0030047F1F